MSKEQLTRWGAVLLKVFEFIKANPTGNPWVEEWLAYCAANGFLFVAKEEGAVVGVAIALPVSWKTHTLKKGNVFPDDFDPNGEVLEGIYLFVDPRFRKGEGMKRLKLLKEQAAALYPKTTHLSYNRSNRGDMRPRVAEIDRKVKEDVHVEQSA